MCLDTRELGHLLVRALTRLDTLKLEPQLTDPICGPNLRTLRMAPTQRPDLWTNPRTRPIDPIYEPDEQTRVMSRINSYLVQADVECILAMRNAMSRAALQRAPPRREHCL
ncbi:hypothetical protein COP2_034028 [Malus domestica]